MKQFAAILLIGVFCFNWFGYRLLTGYLQNRADMVLEAQLDRNNYDESQLIEMRVPLNMPYQTIQTDFERIDGEIQINGIHYKYVKRKVVNGQLILLCIPHQEKMKLQNARDDFFKLVNDLQHPSQNKNSESGNTVKNPVTEYWQQVNDWAIANFSAQLNLYTPCSTRLPLSPFITLPGHPPQA